VPIARINQPEARGRPGGVTALAIFFAAGAVVCVVSTTALLFPGSVLEPMWRLNPRGHAAFVSMGPWAPVLLSVVGVGCAAAAHGLRSGRSWGRRLAIALITINLIGDAANVVSGTEPRAVIGIPITALLLLYLATGRVRAYFAGVTK